MSIISPPIARTNRPLDGKMAWEACIKYGGIYGAAKRIINTDTGRPYTRSGLSRAAYRYALDHLEEIRPQWEQIARDEGIVPTEEAWKDWLRQKAHITFYYQVSKYRKFIEANGL